MPLAGVWLGTERKTCVGAVCARAGYLKKEEIGLCHITAKGRHSPRGQALGSRPTWAADVDS